MTKDRDRQVLDGLADTEARAHAQASSQRAAILDAMR